MSTKSENKFVRVKDVMATDLKSVEGLATVDEAIKIMQERNFGALIVDKRDESDEYGFLTVQDVARKVIEPNLAPDRVNVYEIMTKPVLTIHSEMNIRYAIRQLEQLDQNRALVVEAGKAIGMITMYDMVMHYLGQTEA